MKAPVIVPYLEAGHGKKRIALPLTPLIDRTSFSPTSLSSYPIWSPIPVPCRVSSILALFLFYFLFSLTSLSLGFLKPVTLTSMFLVLATDPCFFPLRTLFALFCLLSTHCSLYHSLSVNCILCAPCAAPQTIRLA